MHTDHTTVLTAFLSDVRDKPVRRHGKVGDLAISPRDKSAMCQSAFVVSCRACSQIPLDTKTNGLVTDL